MSLRFFLGRKRGWPLFLPLDQAAHLPPNCGELRSTYPSSVLHTNNYIERGNWLQFSSDPFILFYSRNITQNKRGNIEIDQIESRRRKYRFGIFLDYATKAYQFSPLLVLLLPPLFQDTVDRPSYLSIRKQQRGTSSLSLSLSPHYEPDSFGLAFSFSREGRGF